VRKGLFLDRDGVINFDHGYVHRIEDFRLRPEIIDITHCAQSMGFYIVVVTNQSGIGRGYYTIQQFRLLDTYMHNLFATHNIRLAPTYFCPYHPISGQYHFRKISFMRKPRPGMLVEACNDHDINPKFSLMIGDNDSDRLAAEAAGLFRFVDARSADWKERAFDAMIF
jgi:D-glycero-D-manno-heptose 1,7-bisphosphate phosphatase